MQLNVEFLQRRDGYGVLQSHSRFRRRLLEVVDIVGQVVCLAGGGEDDSGFSEGESVGVDIHVDELSLSEESEWRVRCVDE